MNPADRVPGTVDSFYLVSVARRHAERERLRAAAAERRQQRRERIARFRERLRALLHLTAAEVPRQGSGGA